MLNLRGVRRSSCMRRSVEGSGRVVIASEVRVGAQCGDGREPGYLGYLHRSLADAGGPRASRKKILPAVGHVAHACGPPGASGVRLHVLDLRNLSGDDPPARAVPCATRASRRRSRALAEGSGRSSGSWGCSGRCVARWWPRTSLPITTGECQEGAAHRRAMNVPPRSPMPVKNSLAVDTVVRFLLTSSGAVSRACSRWRS